MTPDIPAHSRRRAPAMSPEQRREMIVQAAVPLVTEYGAGVTTSQVARAAGIAEGTVFRVFADKDALLDACVAEALRPDRALAELAAISLEQPLADRLTEAAAVMYAHLGRLGALFGALHASGHGMRRPPPPAQGAGAERCAPPDRSAAMAPIRDAVAELFEPEHGSLRLPPDQLAAIFVGLLFQLGAGDPSVPGTDHVIALFLHGAVLTTHEGDKS